MYHKGRGVPRDVIAAHMWSGLAVARGDEQAAENRDLVAREMTQAQIAEVERRAAQWIARFKRDAGPKAEACPVPRLYYPRLRDVRWVFLSIRDG